MNDNKYCEIASDIRSKRSKCDVAFPGANGIT